LEWIERGYEKDLKVKENRKLQDLIEEIFDQLVYLRFKGLFSGILSVY
jgi:hypothetical protein